MPTLYYVTWAALVSCQLYSLPDDAIDPADDIADTVNDQGAVPADVSPDERKVLLLEKFLNLRGQEGARVLRGRIGTPAGLVVKAELFSDNVIRIALRNWQQRLAGEVAMAGDAVVPPAAVDAEPIGAPFIPAVLDSEDEGQLANTEAEGVKAKKSGVVHSMVQYVSLKCKHGPDDTRPELNQEVVLPPAQVQATTAIVLLGALAANIENNITGGSTFEETSVVVTCSGNNTCNQLSNPPSPSLSEFASFDCGSPLYQHRCM